MKDRLYYNLGWDYASYGFPIEDDSPQDMQTGYREGTAHFRHKTKSMTIFDRKWLQLRKNALKRSRQFDDDVTPDFLRYILTPICAITRVTLTSRTQMESDWSVDRVCNIGSYSQGNLAVMSTYANQVKGNMTIEEIRHCMDFPDEDKRLSKREWERMFALCQQVHIATGVLDLNRTVIMPLVAYYPSNLGMTWHLCAQYALIEKVHSRRKGNVRGKDRTNNYQFLSLYSRMKATCDTAASAKMFQKIMARLERKFDTVTFPEDLFWDDNTRKLFDELIMYQGERNLWPFTFENHVVESETMDMEAKAREFSIHSKGFLSEH